MIIFHSCCYLRNLLLLISPYSWCLRDLRVQRLELYTACFLFKDISKSDTGLGIYDVFGRSMFLRFDAVSFECRFITQSLCKCDLSQYHWNEALHFPGKILFLLKTITESVRRGVIYLNLVLSTANGGYVLWNLFPVCGAHITTIHALFIYLFYFQVIFFNRSPILNPRFPILIFQQTLDERQFSRMCLKSLSL